MQKSETIKITIPKPCHKKWVDMSGDNISRHCDECDMKVFNFSEMDSVEIEKILNDNDKVCAKLSNIKKEITINKLSRFRYHCKHRKFGMTLLCLISLGLSPLSKGTELSRKYQAIDSGNDSSNDTQPEKVGEIASPSEFPSDVANGPVGSLAVEIVTPNNEDPLNNEGPERVGTVMIKPPIVKHQDIEDEKEAPKTSK